MKQIPLTEAEREVLEEAYQGYSTVVSVLARIHKLAGSVQLNEARTAFLVQDEKEK